MGNVCGYHVVAALAIALSAGCVGKAAEIATDTEECAANIDEALVAFQQELGLPFDVSEGDGKTVIDEGLIEKQYARDGVRHEVAFRPQIDGDDCDLVFFRRVKREPGSRSSQRGYYGGYTLDSCECAE